MPYFVYILKSKMNDSFYKGSTNDLKRRFNEHNNGEESTTKKYLPWILIWYTQKETKSEAIKLEMKLKNLSIKRTLEFIQKYPCKPIVGGPDVS